MACEGLAGLPAAREAGLLDGLGDLVQAAQDAGQQSRAASKAGGGQLNGPAQ